MVNRAPRIRELEFCNPAVFGDVVLACQSPPIRSIVLNKINGNYIKMPSSPRRLRAIAEKCEKTPESEKRRASVLVDQLLLEIYSNLSGHYTDYNSATSTNSKSHRTLSSNYDVALSQLKEKNGNELKTLIGYLEGHVLRFGSILVRKLKRRDALRRQRDARSDVITYHLQKRIPEFSPEMRFSIEPLPGDSGFSQWHSAMKMVSQLPEGIPAEFRRRLWLALADRHLSAKGINWSSVERNCFSEWSHPTDSELGVQIVKDLHRTGCSLFCGKDGQENQALLKRVLLAYARWNKAVGYCQGFNMLAALILQVTEKCEADALKLMIYLIEGVLPDSYFADSLRGLSVDMAVFRELLRTKLPRLSRHLDTLQVASKEGTTSYEPPLTNVFTMQWFLTLFCNCLPQPTVLRVWDLILLEGNEILLRTALAIWQVLADRILAARSADEFYCVMGMLMREILEFDLINANTLIKGIVTIGPLTELSNLREHYLYNINPWGGSLPVADTDRRMKLYHKDRLVLDIGVLKKQYTKLKERQRQAHIIFNTAVARQTSRRPAPVAMNHLLLGKSALVPAKRLGPPKGAIPPARQPKPPKTLHWKDTKRDSSSSSSDTELCDDPDNASSDEDDAKCNQLPDDNLNKKSSDIDNTFTNSSASEIDTSSPNPLLLDFDCKIEASALKIELDPLDLNLSQTLEELDNQFKTKSDIFDVDTETASDLFDVNDFKIERSNSLPSEDGFDFEKFLEDRVRTLKENSFPSDESIDDTSEQDRIKYARKNSIRALEIIQENSLILHRILQCQSRLTPSPPTIDDKVEISSDLEASPDEIIFISADQDITPTNSFTISNVFDPDNKEHFDDKENCHQPTSFNKQENQETESLSYEYHTFSDEIGNKSPRYSPKHNELCIDLKTETIAHDSLGSIREDNSVEITKSKSNDFMSTYAFIPKDKCMEEITIKLNKTDYILDKYPLELVSPLSDNPKHLEFNKVSNYNEILEYIEEKESELEQYDFKSNSELPKELIEDKIVALDLDSKNARKQNLESSEEVLIDFISEERSLQSDDENKFDLNVSSEYNICNNNDINSETATLEKELIDSDDGFNCFQTGFSLPKPEIKNDERSTDTYSVTNDFNLEKYDYNGTRLFSMDEDPNLKFGESSDYKDDLQKKLEVLVDVHAEKYSFQESEKVYETQNQDPNPISLRSFKNNDDLESNMDVLVNFDLQKYGYHAMIEEKQIEECISEDIFRNNTTVLTDLETGILFSEEAIQADSSGSKFVEKLGNDLQHNTDMFSDFSLGIHASKSFTKEENFNSKIISNLENKNLDSIALFDFDLEKYGFHAANKSTREEINIEDASLISSQPTNRDDLMNNTLVDFNLEKYRFQSDTDSEKDTNDSESRIDDYKYESKSPQIGKSPKHKLEPIQDSSEIDYSLEKYRSEPVSKLPEEDLQEVFKPIDKKLGYNCRVNYMEDILELENIDDLNLEKSMEDEVDNAIGIGGKSLELINVNKLADDQYVATDSRYKNVLEAEEKADLKEADYSLEKYRSKTASPIIEEEIKEELIEIDKNSKYNSILEYSRNLDEKFNNLIIKSGSPKRFNKNFSLDAPEPEKRRDPKVSLSYTDFLDTLSKQEYSYDGVDTKSKHKSPDSNTCEFTNLKYNISPVIETIDFDVQYQDDDIDSDIYTTSSTSTSENDSFKTRKSLNRETLGESHNLKSPNRIYNPFPVNISSRQNKEVALKLGLYKK